MTEYLFENEDELAQFPSRILNAWAKVDGWRFRRQNGVLCFMRVAKEAVRSLNDDVAELRSIIKRLIVENGLKYSEEE
jgi:hypothetical protein